MSRKSRPILAQPGGLVMVPQLFITTYTIRWQVFSEIDTFRNNQIRDGMLTREEALRFAEEENKPRYESIKWYCDTIGIDLAYALRRINAIPKLYRAS